ncbi:aldo/keto reductase [Treponema primitia]|uniref:aldo/keto reductase n=1 Tax=Treponema primitia TaxID=88058 RepID=UPI00025552D3|nr:aldo/keto reductase [Treponema primitia]
MKYITLGNTNLNVSRLCIGTAQLGAQLAEADGKLQLDLFFERGGNFIDTAHVYSDWVPGEKSRSERIIGAWMKEKKNREALILSTKGAHPEFCGAGLGDPRLGNREIENDLNGSLEKLQTEYIDLYFLHRDDTKRPVEEIIDFLDLQIKKGKIRFYGCSNWTLSRIKEAAAYAAKKGSSGFVCNQLMWSLADIQWDKIPDKTTVCMDAGAYAYHKETGLGAMAFTSFANGYFTRLEKNAGLLSGTAAVYDCPENRRIYETLIGVSRSTGMTITDLSYAYFDMQPFPAVPIASFRNDGQLLDALHYFESPRQCPAEPLQKIEQMKRYCIKY